MESLGIPGSLVALAHARDGQEPPAAVPVIRVTRGSEAHDLLASPSFIERWRLLYESCPWATPFQSPEFASAWYTLYRQQHEPVLVHGYTAAEELVGLLTLACPHGSGELVGAGTPQSEYQVWLTAAAWSETFPGAALAQVAETFPYERVTFEYLPAKTPLAWARGDSRWAGSSRIEAIPRPLIDLRIPDLKKKLWKNKTTRNLLNRLKRNGKVCLEEVTDAAQLESWFGEMVCCYDCRIGALTGLLPFWNDRQKKRLLVGLLAVPGFLHITVLRVGEVVVAANIGFCHTDTVSLGVLAHSPFQANYSPGKILVLLLAERLAEEGFATLDLTPDGEWKDRIATDHDAVHKMTVYLRPGAYRKQQTRERVKGVAKRLLERVGVNPQRLASAYEGARSVGIKGLPGALCRQAARLFRAPELRVYAFKPAGSAAAGHDGEHLVAIDRLDHLLAATEEGGRRDAQSFLSQAMKRIEGGSRAHTCVRDGRLLWSCWSLAAEGQAPVAETDPAFVLPPRSAAVFGFHAHLAADADTTCRTCLQEVLDDLRGAGGLEVVYLLVDTCDKHTCRAAERLGAVRDCSLRCAAPAGPQSGAAHR